MNIAIEHLILQELVAFLRKQADEVFSDLKDEGRLNMLAEKWCKYAEFCICRDEDGQLVGMIAFYANQCEGCVAYIPHVYVDKAYRGKGVFAGLFLVVKDYVRDKGFSQIRLEVKNNNLRARRAYQNIGFQIAGEASEESIFMTFKICVK